MNRTLESDKELLKLRYARSIPKLDLQLKERLTKEGWTKLKEPGSLPLAVLISIPFMLVNGLIFLLLIYLLKPAIFNFGEIQPSIHHYYDQPSIHIVLAWSSPFFRSS